MAIELYQETFNENSKKLNTFMIESLQFLKRIHEKKNDHK